MARYGEDSFESHGTYNIGTHGTVAYYFKRAAMFTELAVGTRSEAQFDEYVDQAELCYKEAVYSLDNLSRRA